MTEDEKDQEKRGNPPQGVASNGSGTNNLLGLFAPPPKRALDSSSLFAPPSESDPLLSSTLDYSGFVHDFRGKISLTPKGEKKNDEGNTEFVGGDSSVEDTDESDDENVDDNLAKTVRRINHQIDTTSTNSEGNASFIVTKAKDEKTNGSFFSERNDGGREFFLKTAAASPAQQQQKADCSSTGEEKNLKKIGSWNLRSFWGSLLAPFASPSTWMGGILFVLYHVVFCMANGGSITRPYSGGSLLGDMARYTALGIIVSCPFLVFALSDRTKIHQVGIPAMYPSADLFLAPFLAEAAAIIDKTIFEDWKSGVIVTYNSNGSEEDLFSESDPNDELFLTRLWFGSFALVVSFGMFAAGSLLILASKIKLANLGTYLPYGVLCGFFSSVGVLMWKLAITIDTPTNNKAFGEDGKPYWTVILMHHLPSLLVGIAMNRQGPKHPFVVTGLIILTVVGFYAAMLVMGISLDEARADGWFYTHAELQSSSSSVYSSIPSDEEMGAATNADESWWNSRLLPPCPFGTWFALLGKYVHWRAVWKGAEQMMALAVLYLLRASIHAAALKKNIHNLIRRVPVDGTPKAEDTAANTTSLQKQHADLEVGSVGGFAVNGLPSSPKKKHRRIDSLASVSSGMRMMAQTVKAEVRIVNLSLADRQSLRGKCYASPRPSTTRPLRVTSAGTTITAPTNNPLRVTSIGSTTTAGVRNIAGEHTTELVFPISPDSIPPVPQRSPLKHLKISERSQESDAQSLILPTAPREISTLTQRTIASLGHSLRLSPEKKKLSTATSINVDNKEIGKDSGVKYSDDYVEIYAPQTDLTLEDIFVQYGYGLFVTGACGGFGCCPTIATSNTMYAIGAGKSAPQYFSVVLLLVAFYSSGFELVRFIPKAAFSSLLVLSAVDNIVTWFIKPISKMDNLLEWSVVPFITMFSLLVGFLNAVILGIGVSTFLFVTDFFRVGVVKYDASGLEIRSRIERSLVQSVWLDTHGDGLRVLVLQNYLFFGNASSVLGYIETMFEEIPLSESIRLEYPIPPVPAVLVLDLSLITGMDTSAVDVFMDIWRVCKSNDCKLYLCGLSPRLKKTFAKGGMKPDTKGARKSRTLLYFSDLDHGLGRAEDVLIDKDMGDFARQSLFQLEKGRSGFHVALQYIDQLHSTSMAEGLLDLEPHTTTVTLEEGQILYEKDGGLIRESDHGLFFIESGMIREDDGRSNRTNTRTGGSLHHKSILAKGNDSTLRGKHARLDTAAQRAALSKLVGEEATHASNNLRIATAGPGWVVGANEFAMGRHSLKKFKAITKVKMHHLRFSDLTKIENENPALVLRLYKMLTHVMARKEEDTVAHLSTLHDILSSPVHSKPSPRLSISLSKNSVS